MKKFLKRCLENLIAAIIILITAIGVSLLIEILKVVTPIEVWIILLIVLVLYAGHIFTRKE